MPSRKSKHRKELKEVIKTKTKNGEAEVFVLPPNLLQKLGINLGINMNSTEECPTETANKIEYISDVPVYYDDTKKTEIDPKAPKEKEKQGDNTILETAKLMKKSVFLSPTFITSNNNIDPGEDEILNGIEPKNVEETTHNSNMSALALNTIQEQETVAKSFSKIEKLAVNIDSKSNEKEVGNNESDMQYKGDKEISSLPLSNINLLSTQDNNEITRNTNVITDISYKSARPESTDDHPDEAYLSDCSNSTSGPLDNAEPAINFIPEVHDFNVPKDSLKKIKIISEEIISPSKFKDLQIMLSPEKSNFIPVSMSCVVTSNNFSENLKDSYELPANYESGMSNNGKNKDSDFVMLYDEKGNVMSTVNNNVSCDVVNLPLHIDNTKAFDMITNAKIEDLSQSPNEVLLAKDTKSVTNTPETNFGDMDLVVIDMEIEENEDILEKFVNEITSNDDDNILKKIEQSEKYCSPIKSDHQPEILQANNTTPNLDLECILPENCYIKSFGQKDKDIIVTSYSHNNTLNCLESDLSKVLNESEKDDKVMQILEMVTNCKKVQTDKNPHPKVMDEEDIDKSIDSDNHNFGTEIIAKQTECNDKVLEDPIIQSNINEKENNVMFMRNKTKSIDNTLLNVKQQISESLLIINHNSIPSDSLTDNAKKTETEGKLETKHYDISGVQKELSENSICIASNSSTTITTVSSKEKYTNSPSKKLNKESSELNNENGDDNVPDDKVKEIAMYLSQFAKTHKSVKLRRKSVKNLEIPTNRSKENLLTSKMYIQGVEKPGGTGKSEENYVIKKVLKTYTRVDQSHKRSTFTPLTITSSEKYQELCVVDYEKESSNIMEKSSRNPEFCLCGDFGRLAYYDSDYPYEHIHFWDHSFVLCDRESVFSIYNDDSSFTINTEITVSDLPDDDQAANTLVNSICWHSCKRQPMSKQNYETCKTDNEETVLTNISNVDGCNEPVERIQVNTGIQVNSMLDIDSKFQSDHTPATVSQSSEMHKLDLNTTEISISQTQTSNEEKVVEPGKTAGSCSDNTWQNKVSKKNSVMNNNDDKPSEILETVLQTAENIIIDMEDISNCKKVEKVESIEKNIISNVITEEKEKKEKSKSSKNDNTYNTTNVYKHMAIANDLKQSVNQNTTVKYTTSKCSNIDANISRNTGNLKSVDKQNAIVEDNKQPLDQNTSQICMDNIEEKTRKKKRRKSEIAKGDNQEEPVPKKSVKCDVCKNILGETQWENHVSTEHCFIAWKTGSTFDFEKPRLLKKLQKRAKLSSLKCTFCSAEFKNAKKFLTHVQRCYAKLEGSESSSESEESTMDQTMDDLNESDVMVVHQITDNLSVDEAMNQTNDVLDTSKCGVCQEIVPDADWYEHIRKRHDYLAWKDGDSCLNLDDEEDVRKHLLNIVRAVGELFCSKCGRSRRYPKSYLQHIRQCTGEELQDTQDDIQSSVDDSAEPPKPDDIVKCGVCSNSLPESDWIQHILEAHDYIAWKEGEQPLDTNDTESVWTHLYNICKQSNGLVCKKCGIVRKYAKSYMQHIQNCTGSEDGVKAPTHETKDVVQCAVCSKSMPVSEWSQHIFETHDYLAWVEGDPPLNFDDADEVRLHLYNICKENEGLTCKKCGCKRKYVKMYMQHVEKCTGPTAEVKRTFVNPLVNNLIQCVIKTEEDTSESSSAREGGDASSSMVTCGVCKKEVWTEKWIQHMGRVHNYMAWKEGESLDLNSEEEVYNHLYEICRKVGYLVCSKCGVVRKYVKTFIQHARVCNSEGAPIDFDDDNESLETDAKLVCALCSEEVHPKQWKNHKMDKHYNVAWTVGSLPVDFKNPNVVDSLLKEYMEKYKKLVCKVCNATRVSRVGFFAHIIQCGKTEEEVDIHKNVCDKCNKKYLNIYHSQHMAWHVQQEYAREKKLRAAEEQEKSLVEEKTKQEVKVEDGTPGRRRAAEKARNIIENFKNEELLHKCPKCKFESDSKEELDNHECKTKDDEPFSDSEESAKLDNYSSEESDDSIEVQSNVSDEEEPPDFPKKKRKKNAVYTQVHRFPFVPKNLNMFLVKIGAEYREQHFTYDSWFPELRTFDCEPVPPDQLSEYLPSLEESCKVQLCKNGWTTYKRFQAEKKQCTNTKNLYALPCQSMFTGGCIQCISWSPPGPDDENCGGNFLAVVCHRGPDITRMQFDEITAHPGLIQLWHFGDFTEVAEFVLGMAHDYGTAWDMSWCPSGARDMFPQDPVAGNVLRLGLLAVAFSNGRVAIFSVPYPSTLLKRNKVIQIFKPVAELRLTMNPERRTYQATSVSWSSQKPNESIAVGYADGTVAYFDLNTESPFLKTVENDVIILYPYHDERIHNKCVTGVDLYPSVDRVGPAGAACSSSSTGAALVARPGVRPARQHTISAIGGVQFAPLWPSAVLTGDDANIPTAVNEVEWFGGGRRMGGASAGAGCARCGRLALAALPLLRVRYPHPADNVAKRQIVGVLEMTPFRKKQDKLTNDELQTKIEPTTYEHAIKKYGIELRMDKDTIKNAAKQPRETYPDRHPERFPLGDVTSMAFCPDVAHHKQLAVATHAGIIFVLQV